MTLWERGNWLTLLLKDTLISEYVGLPDVHDLAALLHGLKLGGVLTGGELYDFSDNPRMNFGC